ncbi:MAG: protein kinase [Anaerolineae bacterium]|nr:protein kinase [Anaerolineae bacterium]
MDLAGKTLGQYEIIDQLGKGGMATVYRAYQVAMNRYVAIKVLPPQFMHDDTFVERFLREARVIANLNHRYVLPIYDFGTAGDLAYIVMRLAEGGTLAQLLEQRGPFSVRETSRIVKQIAAGLDYAHAAGIVHRDLKPQNILIDAKGDVYLSDFGIAKVMETTAKLTGSDLMGTPTYMSPEQGQGGVIDRRADIYALGIVVYEMLTGKVPFTGESSVSIVYQHNNAPVPSTRDVMPKVPASVDAVVRRALAKAPDDRYKTAGEFAQAFETALLTRRMKSAGVEAKPAEEPAPAQRAGLDVAALRRVLARAALILALLVAIALVIGAAAAGAALLSRPTGPEPALSWAADLDTVWDLAFSPGGDKLAAANADGTVRLFNPGTGQEIGVLRGHQGAVNAVAFRPDGEHMATAGADGTVRVWWAITGAELVRLRGHQGSVLSVAYSPDGWRLASGGEDGMLRIWALRMNERGELEGEEVTSLQTPGPVTDVAFSPDGGYLAVAGQGQRVLLSALEGSALPEGVPVSLDGMGRAAAFDTGSDLLAAAGDGPTVHVWNVRNDAKTFTLTDGDAPLYGVAFSPDRTRVASAREDGVRLWSLAVSEGEPGRVVGRLLGKLGAVCALVYSPRGDYVAAAGCDGRVHVWDMTRGGTVAVVAAPTQTPSLTPLPPSATPEIPTPTPTLPRTATPTPTPTETLAPTPVLGQGIARAAEMAYVEETFTNPLDWRIESDDTHKFEVVDGAMEITVFEERSVRWNWLSGPAYVFDDFVYSADVQLVEGQDENYGLIFRRSEDDDFYMAQIIEGNVFEFWERRDGEWSDEPLLRALDVEAIAPPGEVNNMRIEAVGPWVSFFINGEMVGEMVLDGDGYLKSGRVGVFVGSLTGSTTTVARFDNVSVRGAGVLLIEDFSDKAGGWIEEETGVVERGYDDETYFINVLEKGNIVWSFAAEGYRDVVMDVDITYEGSADRAAYGLVCRRNEDNNMYEAHLFPNQEVVIWRMDDFGGRVALRRWTDVVPLEPGEARNILRMACVGDTIAVAVNGVYLGSVTDTTYRQGQIGLAASSFNEGDVDVRFDNLAVTGK